MTELRYAVILTKDVKTMDLARALAAIKKVPEQDVINGARRAWGIVEDDLSEGQAKALAASLEARGLDALSLPRTLIEEPPAAQTIPTLPAFKPERLAVLGAAGFKITTAKTVKTVEGPDATQRAINIGLLAAGMPFKVGPKKQEVVKTVEEAELVFYLDLHLKDPVEHLRVNAQDFDYSCLGARKVYSAMVNFRQIVCDLADASPNARRSRGSTILLEQRPVREMGYDGLPDLERECRWLLTLAALKR